MQNNKQKQRFLILFAINFIITLAFAANDSLFPIFYNKYYSQSATFGFAFAFYSASKIIFSPLAGSTIDRYGTKTVLIASILLFTAVSCMFSLVHDAKAILILRAVQGVSCAMFRPVMYCLLEFSGKKKGNILGIFDISFYSAIAAAPFAGSIIVESFGFSYLFIFTMFCCCICLFFAFFIENNGRNKPSYIDKKCNISQKTDINIMMFYIFCRAWGISTVTVFLPIYLLELSVPIKGIGVALSLSALLTAMFLPFTGRLADRFHKEILIYCGGLVVSSLLIVTVMLDNYTYILTALLFSGVFSAVSQPACLAFLLEHSENSGYGSVLGQFNMFMGLGFACSPVFSSLILKYTGIKSVFIFSGLVGITSVIVFCLKRSDKVSTQTDSGWSTDSITRI